MIAARRVAPCFGIGIRFPMRIYELVPFEPAKGGIDSSTGQPCGLHDFEAKAVAKTQGLKNEGSAMG